MNFDLSILDEKLVAAGCIAAGRVHWFDRIDSTNTFLLSHPDPHGRVCLAGLQTAGRGRRGKKWQAPFMSSILMSLGWRLSPSETAGLSLVCGVAVAEALAAVGVSNLQLKWPNDILLDGKKLGGILVELSGDRCAIGTGINVNIEPEQNQYPAATRTPWTDLTSNGVAASHEQLVYAVVTRLCSAVDQFSQNGLPPFLPRWNALHRDQGQKVTLSGQKAYTGLVRGVDARGGLVLEADGEIQTFYAGEVSLSACAGESA